MSRQSTANARATDWDKYYERPYKTASLTRRFTRNFLINQFTKHCDKNDKKINLIELGGANSCFFDDVYKIIVPKSYTVIDNNLAGLKLFSERTKEYDNVHSVYGDLLSDSNETRQADIVFSIGLIEHFDVRGTEKVLSRHFDYLRDGGLLVVTAPTPTLLYGAVRGMAEFAGQWIFHDERPLRPKEICDTINMHGNILEERILWPLILTQYAVVAQKYSLK